MASDPAEAIPFAGPAATIGSTTASAPFKITRGRRKSAWKIAIYGTPGVGKSSIATRAPKPFFFDLENGLNQIDCDKTEDKITSLDLLIDGLRWFKQQSDYETAVIDTVDELEKMLANKVVTEWNRHNKVQVKTVADIPYGRGGDLLVAEWKAFINGFESIQALGKNVLLVGHEQIVKFENPTDANYDFYTLNIHKKSAPVVTAKMDAVLFARFETFVDADGEGKRGKANATGRRVLHTQQKSSFIAKNRFGLPEEIEMKQDGASVFDLIAKRGES